jgi:hypothetical protein
VSTDSGEAKTITEYWLNHIQQKSTMASERSFVPEQPVENSANTVELF